MPLTDTAIRNARIPNGKKMLKLTDGDGMYLLVNQAGRYFRFDFAYDGRRKTLALGVYPETGLKLTREKRDKARRLLAEGINPNEHRKIAKAMDKNRTTDSFEAIAREWIAKFSPTWATTHTDKIMDRLERDAFPWVGGRPIRKMEAPELLECARRVEARGALKSVNPETVSIVNSHNDQINKKGTPNDAQAAFLFYCCLKMECLLCSGVIRPCLKSIDTGGCMAMAVKSKSVSTYP
ncbi:MAG: integrase arm-type DNA-binding domain-containing protein [Magnetococcales bacterium]|nr:integrase arm-type DNA-binding domain-containing protein [Magnetococcales bacterium]